MVRHALCVGFIAMSLAISATTRADLAAGNLRCESLDNPLAIETTQPRLSWLLESAERGQKQTAYRILVADTLTDLSADRATKWDSGKVQSDQTIGVTPPSSLAQPEALYYWKVKVWDRDGRESAWSKPAFWSVAPALDKSSAAHWITQADASPLHTDRRSLFLPPAHHYRKGFSVASPVVRALAHVSALGLYELYVNGQRVGDAHLTPGWSDYRKRAYYNTYDITSLIKPGENAVGAVLADGWYSGYVGYGLLVGYGPNKVGRYFYGKTPALFAELDLIHADGTREVVGTDDSWKVTADGPEREADIIMGETYDARKELAGWSLPGFKADGWANAVLAEKTRAVKATFSDVMGDREVDLGFHRPAIMQAYPGPPVRVTREIKPLKITEPKPGVFIYDMGENIAGIVRLKVRGTAGTKVQIRYGEMLHPDGHLMTENLRRARATDSYILRGDPAGETWSPAFTYHGFQYVELSGLPEKPSADAITALVMHSDTPPCSTFECSDAMVNQLYQNIVRTQFANFVDIPTDCPQRDERLGWMGDAQTYVRTATYNADVQAFFTKWLDDVEESQRSFGAYPDYAPYPMAHGKKGESWGTAWTDAGIICPWTIWHVYGDTRVISRHYESMQRFMAFRKSVAPKHQVGNPWGDWLSLGEVTPVEYVDVCFYAYSTKLMSEMAAAIGKEADAKTYRAQLADIIAAFNHDYVKPDGTLKVETQSAYVLALSIGLLPQPLIQPAADHLAKMIEKNGFRMATGFLGTKPLLPVLSATGHHDLAVRLLQSRKFPSWGYEVANGATSVWERWDSYTKEDAFGKHNAAMNSFSHYSFGAVCEWMFSSLAGIDTDGPAYRRIILHPGPPTPGSNPDVTPLNWVKASYNSINGRIVSNWEIAEGRFDYDVTIPPNTTATVTLPAARPDDITESGKALSAVADIQVVANEGGQVTLTIVPGSYHFAVKR